EMPQPPMNPLSAVSALAGGARQQWRSAANVTRAVYDSIQKTRRDPEYTSIFQAPQCILNDRITGSRRFAAQSYSMTRVRAIARAFDATINDVILGICGAALRDYL